MKTRLKNTYTGLTGGEEGGKHGVKTDGTERTMLCDMCLSLYHRLVSSAVLNDRLCTRRELLSS